ncbi:anti-sigma regulatory factor [Porifericola rhodea]|uniref:anti-sigma regulatory factor n=1 Tax=Porifericola rhodea TaxID=930972 RepID=UPI0026650E50|nr:anti-sigma regulatory factor [Porifericola rhodea]WKN32181.1 anti-sigma regulatory factor [Porifericola rhodea]
MAQRLPSYDGRGNSEAYKNYRIEDRSFFAIIKREISPEAEKLGFSAQKIAKIHIVVNELVTNLLKFGEKNRELLWKTIYYNGQAGIEILTLDKGPGIRSISQAMEDGFSTSGTAGEGLGAIKRQSDYFDIYSQSGQGTVVLARFFAEDTEVIPQPFNFAAFSVARPGEKLCGDGYYLIYKPETQTFQLLLLDGLGHGEGAYEASQAAIAAYQQIKKDEPAEVLKTIHQEIKKTRGAVAMALAYEAQDTTISYCGVGNISGKMIAYNKTKHFSSFNGIVGHAMSSRINNQKIKWERGSQLLLHSDGLVSRSDPSKYTQLQNHDPAILAACLYRDYSRGNDDTTIIICKHPDTDGKASKGNY